MTTITVDNALLEEALDALDEATTYTGSQTWSPSLTQEILDLCVKLRAALAVGLLACDRNADGEYIAEVNRNER